MGRGILVLKMEEPLTDLSLSRLAVERARRKLTEMGSRILDWSLEEDLSKIILIVDTPLRNVMDVLNMAEDNIRFTLRKHGIGMRTEVKAVIEGLEMDRDLMLKLLLIRDTSLILDIIVLIRKVQDYKSIMDLMGSHVNIEFIHRCIELYRELVHEKEFENLLASILNYFRELSIDELLGICSAIMVVKEVEGMLVEEFLEKYLTTLHVFNVDKLETIRKLKELEILAESKTIQFTDRGKKLYDYLNELRRMLLLKLEEKKDLSNTFESINKNIKYIVMYNGRFIEFRSQKILESLVRAGIDVDISIKCIDRFISLLPLNVVSSECLLRSISNALMLYDPSGRSSSLYEFYVGTGKYLIIKLGNTERTLTFKLVRNIVKEISKTLELDIPSYVEDEVVERVYESVRTLASLSAQRATLMRDYYSIEIEEGLLRTLCQEGLRLSIATPELLSESLDQSIILMCARRLLTKSVEEIYKTTVSIWGYRSLIRGLFYISSAMMVLLRMLPGSSLVANASVLLSRLEDYKKGKIEAMVDIHEDVGRISHLLKSVYRIVHVETVDEDILKLALRLARRLICLIDNALE